MYRFAQGRAETEQDSVTVDELSQRFQELGYRYTDFVIDMISRPSFSLIRTPE